MRNLVIICLLLYLGLYASAQCPLRIGLTGSVGYTDAMYVMNPEARERVDPRIIRTYEIGRLGFSAGLTTEWDFLPKTSLRTGATLWMTGYQTAVVLYQTPSVNFRRDAFEIYQLGIPVEVRRELGAGFYAVLGTGISVHLQHMYVMEEEKASGQLLRIRTDGPNGIFHPVALTGQAALGYEWKLPSVRFRVEQVFRTMLTNAHRFDNGDIRRRYFNLGLGAGVFFGN